MASGINRSVKFRLWKELCALLRELLSSMANDFCLRTTPPGFAHIDLVSKYEQRKIDNFRQFKEALFTCETSKSRMVAFPDANPWRAAKYSERPPQEHDWVRCYVGGEIAAEYDADGDGDCDFFDIVNVCKIGSSCAVVHEDQLYEATILGVKDIMVTIEHARDQLEKKPNDKKTSFRKMTKDEFEAWWQKMSKGLRVMPFSRFIKKKVQCEFAGKSRQELVQHLDDNPEQYEDEEQANLRSDDCPIEKLRARVVDAELDVREKMLSSRGDNEQYMITVKFKHARTHLKVPGLTMELPAKEVMVLGAWHTCRVDRIEEQNGEERYHLKSFASDALVIALCRCLNLSLLETASTESLKLPKNPKSQTEISLRQYLKKTADMKFFIELKSLATAAASILIGCDTMHGPVPVPPGVAIEHVTDLSGVRGRISDKNGWQWLHVPAANVGLEQHRSKADANFAESLERLRGMLIGCGFGISGALPAGSIMNPISAPQTYVDERKNSSIVVDAGVTMELTGIKIGVLDPKDRSKTPKPFEFKIWISTTSAQGPWFAVSRNGDVSGSNKTYTRNVMTFRFDGEREPFAPGAWCEVASPNGRVSATMTLPLPQQYPNRLRQEMPARLLETGLMTLAKKDDRMYTCEARFAPVLVRWVRLCPVFAKRTLPQMRIALLKTPGTLPPHQMMRSLLSTIPPSDSPARMGILQLISTLAQQVCFRDVLSREYSTVLHCITMPLLSHEPILSATVIQTLRALVGRCWGLENQAYGKLGAAPAMPATFEPGDSQDERFFDIYSREVIERMRHQLARATTADLLNQVLLGRAAFNALGQFTSHDEPLPPIGAARWRALDLVRETVLVLKDMCDSQEACVGVAKTQVLHAFNLHAQARGTKPHTQVKLSTTQVVIRVLFHASIQLRAAARACTLADHDHQHAKFGRALLQLVGELGSLLKRLLQSPSADGEALNEVHCTLKVQVLSRKGLADSSNNEPTIVRWSSGVDILRFAYYTTNADGIEAMIQDETGPLTRFVAQLNLVLCLADLAAEDREHIARPQSTEPVPAATYSDEVDSLCKVDFSNANRERYFALVENGSGTIEQRLRNARAVAASDPLAGFGIAAHDGTDPRLRFPELPDAAAKQLTDSVQFAMHLSDKKALHALVSQTFSASLAVCSCAGNLASEEASPFCPVCLCITIARNTRVNEKNATDALAHKELALLDTFVWQLRQLRDYGLRIAGYGSVSSDAKPWIAKLCRRIFRPVLEVKKGSKQEWGFQYPALVANLALQGLCSLAHRTDTAVTLLGALGDWAWKEGSLVLPLRNAHEEIMRMHSAMFDELLRTQRTRKKSKTVGASSRATGKGSRDEKKEGKDEGKEGASESKKREQSSEEDDIVPRLRLLSRIWMNLVSTVVALSASGTSPKFYKKIFFHPSAQGFVATQPLEDFISHQNNYIEYLRDIDQPDHVLEAFVSTTRIAKDGLRLLRYVFVKDADGIAEPEEGWTKYVQHAKQTLSNVMYSRELKAQSEDNDSDDDESSIDSDEMWDDSEAVAQTTDETLCQRSKRPLPDQLLQNMGLGTATTFALLVAVIVNNSLVAYAGTEPEETEKDRSNAIDAPKAPWHRVCDLCVNGLGREGLPIATRRGCMRILAELSRRPAGMILWLKCIVKKAKQFKSTSAAEGGSTLIDYSGCCGALLRPKERARNDEPDSQSDADPPAPALVESWGLHFSASDFQSKSSRPRTDGGSDAYKDDLPLLTLLQLPTFIDKIGMEGRTLIHKPRSESGYGDPVHFIGLELPKEGFVVNTWVRFPFVDAVAWRRGRQRPRGKATGDMFWTLLGGAGRLRILGASYQRSRSELFRIQIGGFAHAGEEDGDSCTVFSTSGKSFHERRNFFKCWHHLLVIFGPVEIDESASRGNWPTRVFFDGIEIPKDQEGAKDTNSRKRRSTVSEYESVFATLKNPLAAAATEKEPAVAKPLVLKSIGSTYPLRTEAENKAKQTKGKWPRLSEPSETWENSNDAYEDTEIQAKMADLRIYRRDTRPCFEHVYSTIGLKKLQELRVDGIEFEKKGRGRFSVGFQIQAPPWDIHYGKMRAVNAFIRRNTDDPIDAQIVLEQSMLKDGWRGMLMHGNAIELLAQWLTHIEYGRLRPRADEILEPVSATLSHLAMTSMYSKLKIASTGDIWRKIQFLTDSHNLNAAAKASHGNSVPALVSAWQASGSAAWWHLFRLLEVLG